MGKENDLLEAARTGNVVTIGKLLSSGRGRNVLSQALSFRRALGPNCQDTSGYTPLHHAVLNGHRDAIQMLLKFDASPTVADNRGSNPLHLAAWTGNMDIVQTLLTVGVSKDQVNEQNNYLDTPLHFAAQYGHTQVVSILLDHGADPTLCNRKEEGPLDLAAQYGRLDTVQLLVRLRPDLLSKVPDSRSLLHLAAKNGHHRIVKLLLEAGCDINKTTKNGTALHEAAVFGKIEVVRVLLEHRQSIDVEIADSHSETALQKIESHSSKVSQDISKMIMAHIRGEPLPSAVESSVSPLYSDGEHRGSNPSLVSGYDGGLRPSHSPTHSTPDDADMSHNIYDNVPNDGAYLRHYLHQELRAFHSSPPSGQRVLKPLRSHVPPAGGGGDGDGGGGELYMNVNQIPLLRNTGPPKKPQRNSIGILLDQIYDDEGSQAEFQTDVHQQPENRLPLPGSGPTHLEVKGPQYSLSNTLSSQDSDSPPPLPDRNYYDVDQAGEYTQLRRDAPPPKPQKHREKDYSPPQPDYDTMNEGPGNTSTDASEEGRGSIYEVLSTAKSGSPIHGSDYPTPPHHVSIQLHINEPEDDLSLTDVNTTCEGEYNLDHEDDQDLDAYELLSEAMTGGSPSKGRPKPKPRITPTSSSASSVPSTESASPVHKPVPLPRRGKPVPARRSPGSIGSQPSTPSEELTSSTASEHWEGRGGGALERPGTPDQPPPSPNTAMMGIHAKLSASELHYSDYDNPLDLGPCPCDVLDSSTSSSVFFPPDPPQEESVVANGGKQPSSGQLRKLELDLANRSRKFHEFEAAADQLQTRLEKWQARVEESHLSRPYEQSDRESGSIYENVHKSHYEENHQRRSLDNATVLTASNGNHPRALTRQNSSPVQSRSGSPRKPKRSLNSQLSLNITPLGINSSVQFQPKPVLPPKASQHQTTNDTSTSPNGYDNPAAVTGTHFPFENDNPEIRSSIGRQSVKEPALPLGLRSEESGALDNKLVEGNSEEEILKPNASHPFAGSIRSPFSGLIYGSNRGSRSFSLSQQDRFSALHPGRERAGAFSVRMSAMNGTMTDGPAKGDDQGVGIDESSEWEQIESIMNSFGAGLVRESVYVRDFQQDFEKMFESPGRPQSVGEWLDSLNLGQYENMLIANGFDHLDFIGGDIIEEQDLMDIGIVEEIHRRMILEATRCLPIMKPIGIGAEFTPKPASVSDWLRSLLLSDYIPNFLENNISTMERALELWDFELENVLEIPMLGHRKRILASLGDRCRSRHSSTVEIELCPRPHSLDVDITGSDNLELQIKSFVGPEEREEIERHTKPSSSLDIDLYKDYSKEVTSPTRNSTSSTVPEEGSLHPSEDEEFRELISSTEQYARQNGGCLSPKATQRERGMRTSESSEEGGQTERTSNGRPKHSRGNKQSEPNGPQWMHPPDALIRGCCNYTSSYLGSSIIKELHGTESTREACTRLRRSAQQVQKMPAITLSINYAGVKFIDSKSKMVITEHEICNISCVAQDSEDLKTFAYITKDSKHEKLYCHVFTVKTVELATEIILTLGQAFEIAYKMLLKTSHGHHSNGKASSAHESVDEPIMEDTRL